MSIDLKLLMSEMAMRLHVCVKVMPRTPDQHVRSFYAIPSNNGAKRMCFIANASKADVVRVYIQTNSANGP